ncbi:hypothetical protein LJR231_005377 [Phyllobacterium sp. LjRoot231]|uniref:hypothetical protein n=1 Tax=Phyllobacterium sp. LjRoot231 TaxID=3342289 RepID=UPI003ECD55F5
MTSPLPTHPDLQKQSYRLIVATLAREARVGRNAIYTNHRSMIEELRRADNHRIIPDKLAAWEDKLAQQPIPHPGPATRGAASGDRERRSAEAHSRSGNGG